MTNETIVDETIESLKRASQKRQLLLAQIDNTVIDDAVQRLTETVNEELRQSKRLKKQPTEPTPEIVARDDWTCTGLDGSLGYNLQKYAVTISALKRKEKYFFFTCVNGIIDISNVSRLSFLRSVPQNVSSQIIKELSCVKEIEYYDYNVPSLEKLFIRVSSRNDIKKIMPIFKNENDADIDQTAVIDIYEFILKMHLYKPFVFHDDRIKIYCEQDYIIKFWGYVFETFFGRDEHLIIHWGDTQSSACKDESLKMRIDMRLMLMKNEKYIMDGGNCEYAAKATCSKLYLDRLKLVLGAEAYTNEIIKNCPHLDDDDIRKIKVPYLQIMGFKAVLSVLSTKDKGLYVAEDLMRFTFPTTNKHIRLGKIQNLVKALSLMKHLIKNLEDLIEEGKVDHNTDKMKNVTQESSKARVRHDAWISKIHSADELDETTDEEDLDDEDSVGILFS